MLLSFKLHNFNYYIIQNRITNRSVARSNKDELLVGFSIGLAQINDKYMLKVSMDMGQDCLVLWTQK